MGRERDLPQAHLQRFTIIGHLGPQGGAHRATDIFPQHVNKRGAVPEDVHVLAERVADHLEQERHRRRRALEELRGAAPRHAAHLTQQRQRYLRLRGLHLCALCNLRGGHG